MRNDGARDILGATCTVLEDKSVVWHVKMPEFIEMTRCKERPLESSVL